MIQQRPVSSLGKRGFFIRDNLFRLYKGGEMIRRKNSMRWVFIFCLCLTFIGCAGKARTLHLGVTQFQVESIAAVDAIDDMRKKALIKEH